MPLDIFKAQKRLAPKMSTPGKNPGLGWFSEERSTPNDLKFLRCRWFAFSTDRPMEIKYSACHVLCQHVEVYIIIELHTQKAVCIRRSLYLTLREPLFGFLFCRDGDRDGKNKMPRAIFHGFGQRELQRKQPTEITPKWCLSRGILPE